MNYEGDNKCQMSEGADDPCRREATQTFREPYTPSAFPVMVCDEHAGHCRMFGYRRVLDLQDELLEGERLKKLRDPFPLESPRLRSLAEAQSDRDEAA